MKLKKKTIVVTKDLYPNEVDHYEVLWNKDDGNDTRYVLRPSRSDSKWSESALGTELVRFQDDGNGVDITFKSTPSIRLGYDELYDLFLLLGEYWDLYGTRVQTLTKGRGKRR